MWGRLWRIDTLFETGQLRSIQRELADLDICLERVRDPLGRWHGTHCAATLALATGRFADATRLAAESYKLFSDAGHPVAFGAYSVILGQAGMLIGCDRSGMTELFSRIPDRFRPEAVDTTRGVATIFPALTLALIRLQQGDRAGAEAAYALAGPVRAWTPTPALRLSAWGHGLTVVIPLGRTGDIEFLADQFEPFRGQHVANGARGCAVQARVELAAALARRRAPGDQERARTALDAAADEAGRLGMVPFTEQIEQLRAKFPATAGAESPLSPRELEVARLVARGLTNRQIGQALYVSERTAENHVQHILVKLGLRNRSQIAAWSSAGEAAAGSPDPA